MKSTVLLLLSFLSAPAFAQASQCTLPAVLPRPQAEQPSATTPRRVMPVSGYSLALSWSPEYCRTRRADPEDKLQCGGGVGRFGFVLHGLWPDGQGGRWPQYCRAAAPLAEPVIRANLCATPSVQLLQHEWAKHGTCMADDPERYFRAARRLYDVIRYPDMNALSRQGLNAGAFADAFAAANPGLDRRMLIIDTNSKGWLREVRVCLGRNLRPRACAKPMSVSAAQRPLKIWRGR